jgi:hypothetical protein
MITNDIDTDEQQAPALQLWPYLFGDPTISIGQWSTFATATGC